MPGDPGGWIEGGCTALRFLGPAAASPSVAGGDVHASFRWSEHRLVRAPAGAMTDRSQTPLPGSVAGSVVAGGSAPSSGWRRAACGLAIPWLPSSSLLGPAQPPTARRA